MRGLTSRGVRPCVRKQARSNSSLTPVRRTVIPPTPKGITAADAFTILLPSVLTAAFVFDVTARQRRSEAWDQRIAAVEAETEELKQKQLAAWSRIQKRSVARGARDQRRMMSTMVAHQSSAFGEDDMDPLGQEAVVNQAVEGGSGDRSPGVVKQVPEQQTLQKRFEHLIAVRLALQMLLQLRTARTNLYTWSPSDQRGGSGYNYSMDYLVNELERISRMIHELKIEQVPWGTNIPDSDIPQKYELNDHLHSLIESFRKGDVHLPDFVNRYVQLITDYKIGPSSQRYIEMMRAFSDVNRNTAMAVMCENCVWEGHQPLSDYAIANMLYRYGTDADGARMAEFLNRLVRIDYFPRAKHSWYRATVNDMKVAIPQSRSHFLLSSLVRAALFNQQQTIAESYATIFFRREAERKQPGKPKMWIVSSFLQSYGVWGSWTVGKRWLEIAVAWLYDIWEAQPDYLGRIILRMLDFCVACDKREEYDLILETAIASGLQVPGIDRYKPTNFSERMSQIRLDWIKMSKQYRRNNPHDSTTISDTSVLVLQRELRGRLAHERLTGETPFDPLESKWMADMVTGAFGQNKSTNVRGEDGSTNDQPSSNLVYSLPSQESAPGSEVSAAENYVNRFPIPHAEKSTSTPSEVGAFAPLPMAATTSPVPSESEAPAQVSEEPKSTTDDAFVSHFFPQSAPDNTTSTEKEEVYEDTGRSVLSFVTTNYIPPSRTTNATNADSRRGYASLIGRPEQISEYIYRFDSAMERVVRLEDKLRSTEAKLAEAERAAQDARAQIRDEAQKRDFNRQLEVDFTRNLECQVNELKLSKSLSQQQLRDSHQELERYEIERKSVLSQKDAMEAENAALRSQLSAQGIKLAAKIQELQIISKELLSYRQSASETASNKGDGMQNEGLDGKALPISLSKDKRKQIEHLIDNDVRRQHDLWSREDGPRPGPLPKTFNKAMTWIDSRKNCARRILRKEADIKLMLRDAKSKCASTEDLMERLKQLRNECERAVSLIAAGQVAKQRFEEEQT